MKIIALSGWKGSGKDTLAAHLIDKYRFKRLAFADILKDMTAQEYNIERSHFDDPQLKEKPILSMPVISKDAFARHIHDFLLGEFRFANGNAPHGPYPSLGNSSSLCEAVIQQRGQLYWTPRALAIFKGGGNRAVDSAYWVQKTVKQAEKEPSGLFVISDLRFCSESEQLARFAGRNNVIFVRVERFSSSSSEDPSERDMDNFKFDFYIQNKGTKEEAFQALENIINLSLQ